ncbi:hypothetical protein BB561_002259 [Smittium simulii]|uniref:CUE domain-containing protein n=1 Tax=Smittium simulii TaxID=133385 RepID=A0A2T9YR23_9FUNG|nr:hypothetical protein BB561_002259 [Smittium simulii]
MQSGLSGAPLTKVLMFITATNSVIFNLLDFNPYLTLRIYPHISRDHQVNTSTEVLLALLLFYRLRVVERIFGSKKFASFIFITSFISKTIEVLTLTSLNSRIWSKSTPGPYNLISSIILQYFLIVPSSYTTKIFGMIATDKIFSYLIMLQMCFYQFPYALCPIISGLIAGLMYEYNISGIKYWRFPKFVYSVFKSFFGNIITDSPSIRRGASTMPEIASSNSDMLRFRSNNLAPATQQQTRENETNTDQDFITSNVLNSANLGASNSSSLFDSIPSAEILEDQIATLQAMFPETSRERIIIALQSSNYNINDAVPNLL